ncbi:MAG: TldD/PmbA family protein [Zetaproteobacteria bacterium CG06_land_8_20_14_3_00_59_53]|nr:MAG: PmbA protein [Zetaproteobacteria bacterium CG2_30_59_37]PIO89985.1 MAG: PmbA protein [Zetaproteobacteria bacterium CG23_combo_of_CG06-09_8_20_14_all_59_86]PIQ64092.1 MAG: PmbA protein [Zetaproteobacteria bacterium CG11_big_fil_rev_8_21_14_0_20_59_439]PIU69916.1 MAG: TldD/PmbA family protein [Zetaproteobacteria bacterium CG06_land_8_20_14_3_00_59_53]PIU97590.1 MAG: TldD/PmbA family protein [Zetaproteobacteria bacterium CG03_land_8_20_14_0_80_59_51]PIY47091.1 MAG: TldD/PmbA family protei
MSDLQTLSAQLIDLARKAGAHSADALSVADVSDAIRVRHGVVESVEHEDSRGIGLRAFVEKKEDGKHGLAFASASTSDISAAGLKRLVEQVMVMARISEADPDAMPPVGAVHPDARQMTEWQKHHPCPDSAWSIEAARDAALACESAALGYSDKISNSEGAESGFGSMSVAYASSDGFAAAYDKTSASLSVSVIAGKNDAMQRDYAWDRQLSSTTLRKPQDIGREAAERTVKRLGAGGLNSGSMPVVFEPRVATSLLGHLSSAVNGRAVLQQRSFLGDSLEQSIFPEFISIADDPDHPDGLGNRLFDGEGSRCSRLQLIDQGRLTAFLTDRYAAGRLKTTPGGHARRGLTGDIGIGSSNLVMQAGPLSRQEMLHEIGNGLLVCELIGFGINGVTGDYSRGASGFLIENGEITRPVQEITIAGNLRDMFRGIRHVGSDLTWFGSVAVPSMAIDGITVAGQA